MKEKNSGKESYSEHCSIKQYIIIFTCLVTISKHFESLKNKDLGSILSKEDITFKLSQRSPRRIKRKLKIKTKNVLSK